MYVLLQQDIISIIRTDDGEDVRVYDVFSWPYIHYIILVCYNEAVCLLYYAEKTPFPQETISFF